MAKMMATPPLLRMVLALLAAGTALARHESEDVGGLLQMQVASKGKKQKTDKMVLDEHDAPEGGSATCSDFCSSDDTGAAALGSMLDLDLDAAGAEIGADDKEAASAAAPAEPPTPAADPEPLSATTSAAAAGVAYALQALIAAIVLDGARRFSGSRSDGASDGGARAAGAASTITAPAGEGGRSDADWLLFMEAAVAGDEEECSKLLSAASWPLAREDAWGCTALHAAAKGGAAASVKRLLELGARASDRDAWDETPLHMAARAGKAACCEALLDAGAEIDAVNAEDRTPLVVAAIAGQEPTCRLLLDRKASAGGLKDEELPQLLSTMLARDLLLATVSIGPLRHFEHSEGCDDLAC